MTAPAALLARNGIDARSGRFMLEVDGLKKYFPVRRGLLKRTRAEVRAVDGVSFAIEPGTVPSSRRVRMPAACAEATRILATKPPGAANHTGTATALSSSWCVATLSGSPGTLAEPAAIFSLDGAGSDTRSTAARLGARQVTGAGAGHSSTRAGMLVTGAATASAGSTRRVAAARKARIISGPKGVEFQGVMLA